MTNNLIKALACAAALAALLVTVGCTTDKADPENVDRRAVERWEYLIAHKAEQAYDYLSPGFRATQEREVYAQAMNNRPVQWKGVKFSSKECEAERCKVSVEIAYSLPIAAAGGKQAQGSSKQSETWILVDGEWYYLPK